MTALDTPVISEVFTRFDPRWQPAYVSRQTQIVMDGPGRSGNSYARYAFHYANPSVRTATHGHTHRLILRGVQLHLPTVVLLRDPRDVVASILEFEAGISPIQVAKAYHRYFKAVLPVLDRVVVAPFDQVITDFGQVVIRCNERFGTTFVPYQVTEASEAAVAADIDAAAKALHGPDRFDAVVARPSSGRRHSASPREGLGPSTSSELDKCRAVYERVLVRSGLST